MFNKFIIYKDNLINNIKQVKKENPNSKLCAMVKANAYGIGDIDIVQILNGYADFFGVACFFEAERIKNIAKKPIIIFGTVEKEKIDTAFSYCCCDMEDLNYLVSLNKKIKIHLKVNTGMNRYGFKMLKEFKQALNIIKKSKLEIEGLFTHFATADELVNKQMEKFNKFVKACHKLNLFPMLHADNSFVNESFNHKLDMMRIGFSLYNRNDKWFLPVAEIKSEVAQIQDINKGELVGYNYRFVAKNKTKIAIIPFGYADGYDMKYIGMDLIVKHKRCKILNILMDCFMLDVSQIDIKKGEEIYLLNKFNSINDYAEFANASVYETMIKFSYCRADKVII